MTSPFTSEQAALRRRHICASDIGQLVLPQPRFGGPLRVWQDKTGRLEHDPDTVDSLYGRVMEAPARTLYEMRTGQRVEVCGTLTSETWPLAAATPDGLVGGKTVQIKCPRYKSKWGEDGSQDIDDHYWPQITWEMAVAGVSHCDVVMLDEYSRGVRIYPDLPFDEALMKDMYAYAAKWWSEHVATDTPPPIDGTPEAAEYLRTRFPLASDAWLEDESPETVRLAMQYHQGGVMEKTGAAMKAEARNKLVALIGDHRGVRGTWGRVAHSNVKGRADTDWHAIKKQLDIPQHVIEENTKFGASYRRFTATIVKDGTDG